MRCTSLATVSLPRHRMHQLHPEWPVDPIQNLAVACWGWNMLIEFCFTGLKTCGCVSVVFKRRCQGGTVKVGDREISRFAPTRFLRPNCALTVCPTVWRSDVQTHYSRAPCRCCCHVKPSLFELHSHGEWLSRSWANTVWPEIFNNSTLCKYSRPRWSHTGTELD